MPTAEGECRRPAAGDCRGLPAETKGGKGTIWFPCPLLTPPNPPSDATPFGRASKQGLRGLGSVRLSAYMQLSCPEFTLRSSPRITVRGQTVQGGRVLLRKALLPSRVYPWSTRRPCGPLAFRCATEGSRSAKEGKGSQEGTGNHMVSCPLLFPPVNTGSLRRRRRQSPPPWERRLLPKPLPSCIRYMMSISSGHRMDTAFQIVDRALVSAVSLRPRAARAGAFAWRAARPRCTAWRRSG